MTRFRLTLALLCLAALALGAAPRHDRMDSVCFYFPDGKTINLPFANPPRHDDNLAIHAALIDTAMQHRASAIASGQATGWEDRMVLSAMLEQWTEGGLSCTYAVGRSMGRVYSCTCDAGGGGCVRVIVQ